MTLDRETARVVAIAKGAAASTVVFVTLLIVSGLAASAASAATPAWWSASVSVTPTQLPQGGEGRINVGASDIGDVGVNAENLPIVIADKLPPGLTATAISGSWGLFNGREESRVKCELATLTCTFRGTESGDVFVPFEYLEVNIRVSVPPGFESGSKDEATVSGGEAAGIGGEVPARTVSGIMRAGNEPTRFGVERYELTPENEGGGIDSQAGTHPFQVTASIALNQRVRTTESGEQLPEPAGLPKDLKFELPAGVIGNVNATPQCTTRQFTTEPNTYYNLCPADTAVGVAQLSFVEPGLAFGEADAREEPIVVGVPVYNLVPLAGEPARFGFDYEDRLVYLTTSVRTGSDYGVNVSVKNITQEVGVIGSVVTFWGVPGDARHNESRGSACMYGREFPTEEACAASDERNPRPLLTLPTKCTSPVSEPLQTTVTADPWNEPDNSVRYPYVLQNGAGSPLALEACDDLPFNPSIAVEPGTHSASSTTGLTVGVHVPQEADETAAGASESDLRDTSVTLPAGMTLNPSEATGLLGCATTQIALESPGAGSCPEASKVGTVQIKTPLLPNELEGSVYVASPQNFAGPPKENPFESLVALYIEAKDPTSGVIVKLAGKVTPNEGTGQLTTTFENTPQLPFEDLKLEFFGGARAPLSTPTSCGAYTSEASFTPYSGAPPVQSTSRLVINSGAEGTSCTATPPFAPSFVAGTTSSQAGAFSPFTLTLSRRDQDQDLGGITVQTPSGLLGDLASVPLCGEAQANAGTCSSASQIGDTTTEAGVGSEPVTLPQAGETADPVYLTGPYGGQPFGLSFVVPAVAGPFNLGTVVVRASIAVNQTTSALTITSSPLPTMLRGIPLDIKTVNVTVNRPGFTFNPTNCAAQAIGATITSNQGASALISSPFAAINCATLPFKPTLAVSTAGRASKSEGASLDVKVTSKGGPGVAGEEANIRSVKVDLPIKLPSRLTTLHKACLAAVFAANRSNCSKESEVGTATAVTPVLAHPLSGKAYLVSHGGEAFPSLEIVLQGEGITLILEGKTDIKKGVTSSTFRTVPDAPISSFELKLPTGKFSILGANLPASAHYDFCGQTLNMPTAITGQNGAVVKPATKIVVTGCPKARKAKKRKEKKA